MFIYVSFYLSSQFRLSNQSTRGQDQFHILRETNKQKKKVSLTKLKEKNRSNKMQQKPRATCR